jgi:hypothetical protein
MDEFLELARTSEDAKKDLVEQLSIITPYQMAARAELLPTAIKQNVVYNKAINIMGEYIMDLQEDIECKDIEITELSKLIGTVPENVNESIKYKQSEIINKSNELRRKKLLDGLKSKIENNKAICDKQNNNTHTRNKK